MMTSQGKKITNQFKIVNLLRLKRPSLKVTVISPCSCNIISTYSINSRELNTLMIYELIFHCINVQQLSNLIH